MKISYESDYEIKIQEPGKKAKTPSHAELGFSRQTKEWAVLLEIVQNPGLTYNIGVAHIYSPNGEAKIKTRNKSYDTNLDKLKQINAKLIRFLNKEYHLQIPDIFKLYELCRDEKSGTYRFKFDSGASETIKLENQIASSDLALSKNQLLDKMEKLHEMFKSASSFNEQTDFFKKIERLSKIAKRKGIPDNEIYDCIKKDEEDLKYNPYENVEDCEEDH